MENGRVVRVAVESAGLASIGHCAESCVLEIEFRGGEVYRYFAVPRGTYDELVGADSKGTYFHHFIRDRFPHARVAQERSCSLP
jgi:hypothetical protein